MKKILIDCGSSVNILMKKAYDQMRMEPNDLKPTKSRIYGFNGSGTDATDCLELPVELGEGERSRIRMLPFIVVDIESPYNCILGRPALADFRATLAPWCLTLKFPTDKGVGVVYGDQPVARMCYYSEWKSFHRHEKGKDVEKIIRIQGSTD